jgi:hypothetical protein
MTRPLPEEILAEWSAADPGSDLAGWQDGIRRYESGNLAEQADVDEAAELMCAGLARFVAGQSLSLPQGWSGESPESAVARTIWNVMTATLPGATAGLTAESGRRMRLALAAMRRCGYQPQDLGGNGFMAALFDARTRQFMTEALEGCPGIAGTAASVDLAGWFSAAKLPAPGPIVPSTSTVPAQGVVVADRQPGKSSGESSVRRTAAGAAAAWGMVKNTASQAQQHVNPVLLQHGVDAVQDALLESKVAKIDKKTGKLKVRKLGVAKAAIRPGQTVRQAIDGAAVGDRLRSYNETIGALPAASSVEEFGSYPSKRDYLRDWTRRLIVAGGVTPTGSLIDNYTNAAAYGICSQVFIPLGASRGISDVSQYFHPNPAPAGTAQETFDALYLKVAPSRAGQQYVNEQIVAFLNSVRDQWTQRIRGQHG